MTRWVDTENTRWVDTDDTRWLSGIVISGIIWGEENPTDGKATQEWSTWKQTSGDVVNTISGSDWGYMNVLGTAYSPVVETVVSGSKGYFTITTDDYQTGTSSGTISVRGSENVFDWDAVLPTWENITIGTQTSLRSWNYVQIKIDYTE